MAGILGFGAAEAVIFCLPRLPEEIQTAYGNSMGSAVTGTVIFMVFFVAIHVILVPLTEEVIFRGILYRFLRNSWGSIFCILVISILFAGTHGSAVQMGYAFLMGILLCLIYEYYGSVLYTTAFHIVFNLFGSGIIFYAYAEYLAYAGTAVFAVSVILFAADVRNIKRQT